MNHSGRWTVATMALVVVMLLAWFRYLALDDSEVAFLDNNPPAEWILYPKPPDGDIHRMAEMETAFRRSFVLPTPPGNAPLTIRGMKRWTVLINGAAVPTPTSAGKNWNEKTSLEVSKLLRPGTNEIVAVVFNSNGPPALWLVLDTGGNEIVSDSTWDVSFVGAAWKKAVTATTAISFGGGNALGGGEQVLEAFRRSLAVL